MSMDGVGMDDPDGWGFCCYCAFEVAVNKDSGIMYVHDRRHAEWSVRRCYGSLLEPTPQPAPEARPKPYEEAIYEAMEAINDAVSATAGDTPADTD